MATEDFIAHDEFLETSFYIDWVRPKGLVDCAVADDETQRRMRLIAPHLRRAALIGRVIDLKTTEAAAFADTLVVRIERFEPLDSC